MWKNLPHGLEDIPESELDGILQHFIAKLRKQDGGVYEPDSVRTMLTSLDRFLCDKGWLHSILKDKSFEGCRKVFNGKAIELREKGMGKKEKKSDPLSEKDEEQLWRRMLGSYNPKSLNYTIFYVISQQFVTRGCQEHHQLQIEDLKFVHTPSGATIICWVGGRSD